MPVSRFVQIGILLQGLGLLYGQVGGTSGGGFISYDGPDILGRAGPTTGLRGSASVPIHVQASINGTYDSSILGYSVDDKGNLSQRSSYGANATITASGRKIWRRSFLGIDYSGDYAHYPSNTFYNGSNHQMNLVVGRQFGRKWQIISQIGAGTSNRFVGNQAVLQASELEFLSAPTAELFDSRSFFGGISAGATYSFSRRNSVRFSGNSSTVRRRAQGLVDMQSYGASGDWVHRLDRRSSVGINYTFTHFDFQKVFGESAIHTVGVHLARLIGRDWNISGSVSGSRQNTVGIRTIALDPVLAAILGRGFGAEVFESSNLLYGYTANIGRRIRHSSVYVSASRNIIPGNGYFLTSINQSFMAGASHNVTRDLALNASFGYSKLTSLGFASGAFKGWTGGGSMTYKVTESIGFNVQYYWRNFSLAQTTFGRTGHRVSIGLTYFPQRGLAGLF